MSSKYYNSFFYSDREGTVKSAEILAPMIHQLLEPQSVVDVGCGLGEFLAAFRDYGVNDILGIDGEWVNKEELKIHPSNFETWDLKKTIIKNRKFDLVICSEVAEHIDEEFADTLIKSLVSLGNVVAFSAAIPYQGGTFHVNEQWPQYWVDKFSEYGFIGVDYLRPRIWMNSEVKFWYKQNLLLFVNKDTLTDYPELHQHVSEYPYILPIVHPALFSFYARRYKKMTDWVPKWLRTILRKVRF